MFALSRTLAFGGHSRIRTVRNPHYLRPLVTGLHGSVASSRTGHDAHSTPSSVTATAIVATEPVRSHFLHPEVV